MPKRHAFMILAGAALTTLSMGAAQADDIQLNNGDVLRGTVIEWGEQTVEFEHESLGRMSIDRSRLAESPSTVDDLRAAATLGMVNNMMQDEAEMEADIRASKRSGWMKEWDSHFQFGGAGAFGNTDSQAVNASITSGRENEKSRTDFDMRYFWGSTDGDESTNRFTTGIFHEWYLTNAPRWSLFGTARFDIDRFTDYSERLALHAGVGYKLVDHEDYRCTLLAGAGAVREWGSDNDDWEPEALLGVDVEWNMSENQNMTFFARYHPNLEEFSEFRTDSGLEWSLVVDDETNLALNVGVFHQYQSDVDSGFDRSDWQIAVGLGFDF